METFGGFEEKAIPHLQLESKQYESEGNNQLTIYAKKTIKLMSWNP